MHRPARFYVLVRLRVIGPGRGNNPPVGSLILSYQLSVLHYPERCPKKETFLVKAPLFETL
jgi:hypothetical protein